MINIDWSKTPEGTEHSYHNECYKVVNGKLFVYRAKKTGWGHNISGYLCWAQSKYSVALIEKMISRTKPVFTKQMADNGDLPPIDLSVQMRRGYGCDQEFYNGKLKASDGKIIWFCDDKYGDVLHPKEAVEFKPIDTRTDKEKTEDDIYKYIQFENNDNPPCEQLFRAIQNGKIHDVKFTGSK